MNKPPDISFCIIIEKQSGEKSRTRQKLLEKAGVDLTLPATYDKAMAYFASCLDEVEKLALN